MITEDLIIFSRAASRSGFMAPMLEYVAADRKDAEQFRKLKRDGSGARMHIVDRATQGLDEVEAMEIAYGYLYG